MTPTPAAKKNTQLKKESRPANCPATSFRLTTAAIDPAAIRANLLDPTHGAYATFEGWVRNHHQNHPVTALEYSAYEPMAIKIGQTILEEALEKYTIHRAHCTHRLGHLAPTAMAVHIAVTSAHRADTFPALRYIIDELKNRVPIWKKEHYQDTSSQWIACHCGTGEKQTKNQPIRGR